MDNNNSHAKGNMKITNINNGSQAVRSTARFAGCETLEDMKARLLAGESIGVYSYGGRKQVEVRTVNDWGRMVRVATADV